MIEIVEGMKWGMDVRREPEDCIYVYIAHWPQRCVRCGLESDGMSRNWHGGPSIEYYGWFETEVEHDLSGMVRFPPVGFPDLPGDDLSGMPDMVIQSMTPVRGGYRYTFYSEKIVNVKWVGDK